MHKPLSLKKWEQTVANYGCVVTRELPVQLHHVLGRSYVHNKEHIGIWYILPLTPRLHDVGSNHEHNVTHWPKRFAAAYGYQRDLFLQMVQSLRQQGVEIPFDGVILAAIASSPLR